jgi:hypothetical protein
MNMSRTTLLTLAVCIVTAVVGHARAEEALTVPRYCELTIERLRLAQSSWIRDGRPPQPQDEATLWQRYRTTAEAYLRFAGEHRADVERYLAARPDLQVEIDGLSRQIRIAIESRDARR